MAIAIDGVPAAKENHTGVERYVHHILEHMNAIDQDGKVLVFSHRPIGISFNGNWRNYVLNWPLPGWSKLRFSAELFFLNPKTTFVPGDELPLITRGKVVTTIHDLGFKHKPELYSKSQLKRLERAHARAASRADHIIASTEATKRDIERFYNVDPNKMSVIRYGYDTSAFKVRPETDPDVERVRRSYGLPPRYLVYVGRLERKKGLETFIEAYKEWKEKTKTDIELVLIGVQGAVGYEDIKDAIGDRTDIHELGYVGYEDMAHIVSGAHAYVFPTRFEGFGMPVLEALASGVPLICSDLEVLREVGGRAPIYVPLGATNKWIEALDLVMDQTHRAEMIDEGLEWVKGFSWQMCAQQTLDILT